MRVKVGYRTASKQGYNSFCRKFPSIKISFREWKLIIYDFGYMHRDYILSTGEMAKLPHGFGEQSVNKKKRKRIKRTKDGREIIGLAVDWKKTKEKGKKIYHFNHHTEGYNFKWYWNTSSARFKFCKFWVFKASRVSSRKINEYIRTVPESQHYFREWTS